MISIRKCFVPRFEPICPTVRRRRARTPGPGFYLMFCLYGVQKKHYINCYKVISEQALGNSSACNFSTRFILGTIKANGTMF